MLPCSVADPDPGSGAFLTPGSGMGKKSGSGSEMSNPDHISERLEIIFLGLKYLNSVMQHCRFGIRDGKNSDLGSGLNIPDPQHCRHGSGSTGRIECGSKRFLDLSLVLMDHPF